MDDFERSMDLYRSETSKSNEVCRGYRNIQHLETTTEIVPVTRSPKRKIREHKKEDTKTGTASLGGGRICHPSARRRQISRLTNKRLRHTRNQGWIGSDPTVAKSSSTPQSYPTRQRRKWWKLELTTGGRQVEAGVQPLWKEKAHARDML